MASHPLPYMWGQTKGPSHPLGLSRVHLTLHMSTGATWRAQAAGQRSELVTRPGCTGRLPLKSSEATIHVLAPNLESASL